MALVLDITYIARYDLSMLGISAFDKLERAKKHISDFESARKTFQKENADTIQFKDDPKARKRIYYVSRDLYVRPEIPLIVGDAVQNLRSALDHLAHQLMCVGTGQPGPFSSVYFPIAEDADEYKCGPRRRIKRMRRDAIKAIDALEPYGGGKGEVFWHLHQLNNVDKHRMLLTALTSLYGHSIPKSQRIRTEWLFFRNPRTVTAYYGGKAPSLKGLIVPPEVKVFPLKAGTELLTVPNSEIEDDMNFVFEIAFGKPEVVEGDPVLVTLHQMHHLIYQIVMTFERDGLLR